MCNGALLVDVDGSPAAWTEELEGRCYPGPDVLHTEAPTPSSMRNSHHPHSDGPCCDGG